MRLLVSKEAFLTELGRLLQRASAGAAAAPAASASAASAASTAAPPQRRAGSVWVTQKRLVQRAAPGESESAPLCLFRACGRSALGARVRITCVVTREQSAQFHAALSGVLRGGCSALRKVSKKDKKLLQAAKKAPGATAAATAAAAAASPAAAAPPPPPSPAKRK